MTNYDRIKNMTVEELADYLKIKDCPKVLAENVGLII